MTSETTSLLRAEKDSEVTVKVKAEGLLLEALAEVVAELQETRMRLDILEGYFKCDARGVCEQRATAIIDGKLRDMKRDFNAKLKKLGGK